MNIFFIEPVDNLLLMARSLCDQHSSRMIYETCCILGNAYYAFGKQDKVDNLYKPHYVNHPQCRWVRESSSNFNLITSYLGCLVSEFDRKGGSAKSWQRERWMLCQFQQHNPVPEGELTLPYLTFGNKDNPILDKRYKEIQAFYGNWNSDKEVWEVDSWDTAIKAYRHYYNLKQFKQEKLPVWKKDPLSKPTWYEHESVSKPQAQNNPTLQADLPECDFSSAIRQAISVGG